MPKGKIKQRNTYSEDTEVGINYIKILVVLAIVFVAFYLITYFVTNKNESETVSEPTIQYTKILVGNMLTVSKDEYYVLVEFEDDKYKSLYEEYLNVYSRKDDSLEYYIIDMEDGFNKSYVSTETVLDVEKSSDIRFATTTLVKIKGNSIIDSYITNEEIINILKEIAS